MKPSKQCSQCGYKGDKDCVCTIREEENKKHGQANHTIENLVFEGGGTLGAGYGGALMAMDKLGLLSKLKRAGGTSAGAITATLVDLGYTPNEIIEIIRSSDFSSFEDDSFGVVQDTYRLVTKYGWHKGDSFKKWLGGYVKEKLGDENATFEDLSSKVNDGIFGCKELYVVVTNLSKQRAEVYSTKTTPTTPIVDAVRISMSIPVFYQCVKAPNGDILVDGGVANNFPIKLFDKMCYYKQDEGQFIPEKYVVNPYTIGLRVDSKSEIESNKDWSNAPIEINNIKDYLGAIMSYLMGEANKRHLKDCDQERTIFIETGDLKAVNFGIKADEVDMLIANGVRAVQKYFNRLI